VFTRTRAGAIITRVRTLTRRELNRALLARQLLLARGRMSMPKALERVAGLQAQYAPSMYVGLWSRLDGLDRAALTAALERRSVVQATLMRVTIHLVARGDFWPFALATRQARRQLWLRNPRDAVSEEAMTSVAETLRGRLAGGRVLKRNEIETLLGKPAARAVGLWVDLVRVPPSGTWERRRADLYALAEDWIGPPEIDEGAAAEHLVRRYLAGFGPASRADLASWSGIAPAALGPLLERLRLRRFRSEDGDELLDLPRALLPDPDTPAPPRFLPTWDSTLLVHARRTGILPEEHRQRIFHVRKPQSAPTFLVDGAVAGTWRYERGAIRLDPFEPLDRATQRALREEADRLAAFHE
jgi:Winged helix DNA-binding domain